MSNTKNIDQAYQIAQERYAQVGVDTDKVLKQLAQIPISDPLLAGRTTWAASRTPARNWAAAWLSPAITPARPAPPMSCAATSKGALGHPGSHRFNLHACYAEMGGKKVDRDALSADQFKN